MVSNRILLVIIFISIILNIPINLYNKDNDEYKKDSISEQKYLNIIEGLKRNYVIDLKDFQSGGQFDMVSYELSRRNKSFSDYQNDSTKFYQAIIDVHQSDISIVKFLYKFRSDTNHRKLSLAWFDPDITEYNSFWTDKMFLELYFYNKMNNIALTLILNYYLNTEQTTIKLLLDAVYIDKKTIKTEKMFKKLDKIFKKYGYEDKEKIRNAILKDFGKCIDYTQLSSE